MAAVLRLRSNIDQAAVPWRDTSALFPERMCRLRSRASTDWRPDVWKDMLNGRILNEKDLLSDCCQDEK